MSSLKLTVVESIRYRGNIGQWSWISHRISGLAILSFLLIHVWDTANATFWPQMYSYTVEIFKWFPFSVGEIGLMAAILFHAFNGIRISLLDFQPAWWKYQEKSARFVWGLFIVAFVPLALLMLRTTINHCTELAEVGESCFAFPLPSGLEANGLVLGIGIGVIAVGVVLWFVLRRPPTDAGARPRRAAGGSTLERYGFLFMRLSGIALLLLAVGHMLLQHIFRDVHNLTLEVVAGIWRSWGWRAYDLFLLAFAATHGLNGFRNVLEDYVHDDAKVRGINRALAIFLVITIIWSAIAIFSFQPDAVMTQVP